MSENENIEVMADVDSEDLKVSGGTIARTLWQDSTDLGTVRLSLTNGEPVPAVSLIWRNALNLFSVKTRSIQLIL